MSRITFPMYPYIFIFIRQTSAISLRAEQFVLLHPIHYHLPHRSICLAAAPHRGRHGTTVLYPTLYQTEYQLWRSPYVDIMMSLATSSRLIAALAILGRLASGFALPRSDHRFESRQHQENGKLGAVASESSICSQIGVRLIKDGGNAADAVCFPQDFGQWHTQR